MTRKKFIKNITYMYALIIKKAKENGQDDDLVRSAILVRPKDYKLPEGRTYKECWDVFQKIIMEYYNK